MRLIGDLDDDAPRGRAAIAESRPSNGPSSDAPPLTAAEFDASMAAIGPFEDRPFLAVAVSGGADSLALALLAAAWAERRGGRAVGLTVDHGLRPEAGEEARRTGHWLRARGVKHHVLAWTGPKPRAGLQRRAREARYDLLAAWCRDHGCLHLLLAHHRQDQAETVALRKAKKSGDAGLAAMASTREIEGLRLLRPLLGVDKARLIALLEAIGQPWLEDPSNRNPVFARTRLRKGGVDVEALAEEARRAGERRRLTDQRLAALLVDLATIDPAGFAELDAAGFSRLSDDLAGAMLTRVLMTVGGDAYPPRGDALRRALSDLRAPARRPARTLAHCRLLFARDRWLICRERASASPLALPPGETRRWDGRFAVRVDQTLEGVTVEPLGDRGPAFLKALIESPKIRALPKAVRRTLPVFLQGLQPIAVPHLRLFAPAVDPARVEARFHPLFPLAPAPFAPHITP
jgi:tRNA(Ile)-lysidine synthase